MPSYIASSLLYACEEIQNIINDNPDNEVLVNACLKTIAEIKKQIEGYELFEKSESPEFTFSEVKTVMNLFCDMNKLHPDFNNFEIVKQEMIQRNMEGKR